MDGRIQIQMSYSLDISQLPAAPYLFSFHTLDYSMLH